MKNKDAQKQQYFRVYIPGGLPSARDLIELLSILEGSMAWAPIAVASEARDRAHRIYMSTSGEEERKARDEQKEWDTVLDPLKKSYSQFLNNKYGKMLLEASATGYAPHPLEIRDLLRMLDRDRELSKERRFEREELEYLIHRLYDSQESARPERRVEKALTKRSFDGEDFNIVDFSEWVSDDLGRNILQTKDILPGKSIEFLFDVGALLCVIAYQDYPVFKDLAVYSLGVLRSYIGKEKKPRPTEGMRPPTLTPSMIRLMGQYDEVHLEWEGDEPRLGTVQ